MSRCLFAFTEAGTNYPGYINVTEEATGDLTITVRKPAKPATHGYMPMPGFKSVTCRGSYTLGTACRQCERCTWELEGFTREGEITKVTIAAEHRVAFIESLLPGPMGPQG